MDNLPVEIIDQILSFLVIGELVNITTVNHIFNLLITKKLDKIYHRHLLDIKNNEYTISVNRITSRKLIWNKFFIKRAIQPIKEIFHVDLLTFRCYSITIYK